MRAKPHLRHDSVTSYASTSPKAEVSPKSAMHPLLLAIDAAGDTATVAAFAGCLADNEALQVQAMTQAVSGGNPYMVKALLDHGVSVQNAVRACATRAPCGSMQDILNLIDTRNPTRRMWLDALYESAKVCKMRPFVDLMTFLKPRPFELRDRTSILHVAAQAGSFDVADRLLKHGMSPFISDAGKTPFDLAVAADRHMVVKVFIDSAANRKKLAVGVLSRYLGDAVENGAFEVAKVLMRAGAQATPARLAVARKRFEDDMAKVLEANIAAQPVRTGVLERMKAVRLRRQPVMLQWDDALDGPVLLA